MIYPVYGSQKWSIAIYMVVISLKEVSNLKFHRGLWHNVLKALRPSTPMNTGVT